MAEVRHTLTAEAAEMLRTLDAVNERLHGTADAEARADGEAKRLQKSTALLAGALAATAAATAAAIKKSIDYGDSLQKMSQRTGVSVESLSRLKLAAELSDTSLEGLSTGLKALTRGMVDMAQGGTGPAADALRLLGIEAQDGNGNMRETEAVLYDVADAFSRMDDGATKTALAQDLLGKSGLDLIPVLNGGRKALEESAEASERLGLVWSGDLADAAADLNDAITEAKAIADGFFTRAAQAYLPALNDLARGALRAAEAFATLGESQRDADAAARDSARAAIETAAERVDASKAEAAQQDAAVEALRARLSLLESAQDATSSLDAVSRAYYQSEATGADGLEATRAKLDEAIIARRHARKAVEDNVDALRKLRGELDAEAGLTAEVTENITDRVEADLRAQAQARSKAEADKAAKEAAKERAAAERELADALAEGNKAATDALERLRDITEASSDALLGDAERLVSQAEREQARIAALFQTGTEAFGISEQQKIDLAAQAAAARLAVEAKLQADLDTLRRDEALAFDAYMQQLAESAQRSAQERMRVEEIAGQTVLGIADQVATGTINSLRDLNRARTHDLRQRREREIGLAILLGEIKAGLAFGTTLAEIGGTPVGYAAAAAAATAVGVASKVSAAAGAARMDAETNYFHDGGAVDEIDIRARVGEYVLPPTAVRRMGGPEGVEATVERASGGTDSQPLFIVQKLSHRVFDAQTSEAVRRAGSPLDARFRAMDPRGTARHNPYGGR